jgi:WD40 repeat protein
MPTGRALPLREELGGVPRGFDISPDGRLLAASWYEAPGTVGLWELSTGKKLRALHGHRGSVIRVRFFAGGARLVSGGEDGTVRVWDPQSGREMLTLIAHTQPVEGVAVREGGGRLISWSNREIKIWDMSPSPGGRAKGGA